MHQSGLSRRNLLLGATTVAGLPLLRATRALAAPDFKGKTVVFASWGGAYQDAEQTCYCDPFAAATGAKVLQDGPMNDAKFRAMIAKRCAGLGRRRHYHRFPLCRHQGQPVREDRHQARRHQPHLSAIRQRLRHRLHRLVVQPRAYSTDAYAEGKAPQTWADLFDLKQFPGKRTLADNPVSSLEIALLADGVAPDKLYPLDADRALKKLDTIKPDTIFWSTNSQSPAALHRQGGDARHDPQWPRL